MTAPAYPAFDGSQHCASTDPEAWFPEPGNANGNALRLARELCEACPFSGPCGDFALNHHVEGLWSGRTESWRREERKRLGIVAVSLVLDIPRETQQSRIATFIAGGWTHDEIADELGIKVESVAQAARRDAARKAA